MLEKKPRKCLRKGRVFPKNGTISVGRGGSMKISAIRNDYLAYLQYEQNVSKTTFTSYKSGLNRFLRFLAQEGMPDPDIETALSTSVLRKFNLQLGKRGLAPASVHGAFDPLQSLCTYLVTNGVLEDDPTKKIV